MVMMLLEGDRLSLECLVAPMRTLHLFVNDVTLKRRMSRHEFQEPVGRYQPIELDSDRWEFSILYARRGKEPLGVKAAYPNVRFLLGQRQIVTGYFTADAEGEPLMADVFTGDGDDEPVNILNVVLSLSSK
jgi:hypothetical protein